MAPTVGPREIEFRMLVDGINPKHDKWADDWSWPDHVDVVSSERDGLTEKKKQRGEQKERGYEEKVDRRRTTIHRAD